MASKILKGRFQNLFDTASNWTSSNPTLMDGEIAVVKTNDGKIKFKMIFDIAPIKVDLAYIFESLLAEYNEPKKPDKAPNNIAKSKNGTNFHAT